MKCTLFVILILALYAQNCNCISSYSNHGDRYQGHPSKNYKDPHRYKPASYVKEISHGKYEPEDNYGGGFKQPDHKRKDDHYGQVSHSYGGHASEYKESHSFDGYESEGYKEPHSGSNGYKKPHSYKTASRAYDDCDGHKHHSFKSQVSSLDSSKQRYKKHKSHGPSNDFSMQSHNKHRSHSSSYGSSKKRHNKRSIGEAISNAFHNVLRTKSALASDFRSVRRVTKQTAAAIIQEIKRGIQDHFARASDRKVFGAAVAIDQITTELNAKREVARNIAELTDNSIREIALDVVDSLNRAGDSTLATADNLVHDLGKVDRADEGMPLVNENLMERNEVPVNEDLDEPNEVPVTEDFDEPNEAPVNEDLDEPNEGPLDELAQVNEDMELNEFPLDDDVETMIEP